MPRFMTRMPVGACMASALVIVLPTATLSDSHVPGLSHTTVLSALSDSWDLAFLPGGTMSFTEKCHGLSVLLPDGEMNHLLGMGDSEGYDSIAEDLFCEGRAGMTGIAVDPGLDDNRALYVYFMSNMTAPGTDRLMRFTVNEDLSKVADRTDLFDRAPYKPESSDQPFGGPGAHTPVGQRIDVIDIAEDGL